MQSIKLLINTAVLTLSAGLAAANTPNADILEVGTSRGSLLAGHVGHPLLPIVKSSGWLHFPVISPDGSRIAFVQETDKKTAFADVVVVAFDGHELSRTPIEPVIGNLAYSGVRFMEHLRWVSPTQIVISGTINPSTSQYYGVDADTGKIVRDFTDDSSQADFSPDGKHVIYLGDSPHFTPQSEESPTLLMDDTPIWQPATGTTLAAGPHFSPDGASVAWASQTANGAISLDIWTTGKLHQRTLPVKGELTVEVAWVGGRAVAATTPEGQNTGMHAWSIDANGGDLKPTVVTDQNAAAKDLLRALYADARDAGIHNADFWCAACSLAQLPRASPPP